MSDTSMPDIGLNEYDQALVNAVANLERELSAANARIAELEEAARRNGIKVSAPLGSLLSPHDIIDPD